MPLGIYLFKVNKKTSEQYEICPNLTMTPKPRSGVFIFNFKQILHISLLFPLLTLSKKILAEI